jgi:DNA-binding CsgD family transcriptional regulator
MGRLVTVATRPRKPALSPRERDVTLLRGRGVPVKVVAANLNMTTGAVSTFQQRALEKLGFDTLEEAIAATEILVRPFIHAPDGSPMTIAPRLTRDDLRELRSAYSAIARVSHKRSRS